MATRFLLDANLSPLTREFLASSLGLDVTDLISLGLGHIQDHEVVEHAKQNGRVIITLDLDFGEIYHRHALGGLGVVILRLDDQSIQSVNRVLVRFFRLEADRIPLERSLVIVDEHRVRIRTEP